jgi:hypothetical protein
MVSLQQVHGLPKRARRGEACVVATACSTAGGDNPVHAYLAMQQTKTYSGFQGTMVAEQRYGRRGSST